MEERCYRPCADPECEPQRPWTGALNLQAAGFLGSISCRPICTECLVLDTGPRMHTAYRGNMPDILGGEIRLHRSRKGMMSFSVIVPGVSGHYRPRASAGSI